MCKRLLKRSWGSYVTGHLCDSLHQDDGDGDQDEGIRSNDRIFSERPGEEGGAGDDDDGGNGEDDADADGGNGDGDAGQDEGIRSNDWIFLDRPGEDGGAGDGDYGNNGEDGEDGDADQGEGIRSNDWIFSGRPGHRSWHRRAANSPQRSPHCPRHIKILTILTQRYVFGISPSV